MSFANPTKSSSLRQTAKRSSTKDVAKSYSKAADNPHTILTTVSTRKPSSISTAAVKSSKLETSSSSVTKPKHGTNVIPKNRENEFKTFQQIWNTLDEQSNNNEPSYQSFISACNSCGRLINRDEIPIIGSRAESVCNTCKQKYKTHIENRRKGLSRQSHNPYLQFASKKSSKSSKPLLSSEKQQKSSPKQKLWIQSRQQSLSPKYKLKHVLSQHRKLKVSPKQQVLSPSLRKKLHSEISHIHSKNKKQLEEKRNQRELIRLSLEKHFSNKRKHALESARKQKRKQLFESNLKAKNAAKLSEYRAVIERKQSARRQQSKEWHRNLQSQIHQNYRKQQQQQIALRGRREQLFQELPSAVEKWKIKQAKQQAVQHKRNLRLLARQSNAKRKQWEDEIHVPYEVLMQQRSHKRSRQISPTISSRMKGEPQSGKLPASVSGASATNQMASKKRYIPKKESIGKNMFYDLATEAYHTGHNVYNSVGYWNIYKRYIEQLVHHQIESNAGLSSSVKSVNYIELEKLIKLNHIYQQLHVYIKHRKQEIQSLPAIPLKERIEITNYAAFVNQKLHEIITKHNYESSKHFGNIIRAIFYISISNTFYSIKHYNAAWNTLNDAKLAIIKISSQYDKKINVTKPELIASDANIPNKDILFDAKIDYIRMYNEDANVTHGKYGASAYTKGSLRDLQKEKYTGSYLHH